MNLPTELRSRILAEVARTPAPTRALHQRRARIVAALSVVATAALFFVMGGFKRGTRPVELIAFTSGFGLVAALVLMRIAGGAPRSMLGRPRRHLVLASVVVPPVLAAVALVAMGGLWPEGASEVVTTKNDLSCAGLTLLQGALPLLALIIPRKGTDPVHPVITGAALGMTAGAWTAMMAYLRCPHAVSLHCIVAHVVPMVVLALVGALLGRAMLKID